MPPPTNEAEFWLAVMGDDGRQLWLKVEVDWKRLGRLAARAMKNKSRRTRIGYGTITCTVEEKQP